MKPLQSWIHAHVSRLSGIINYRPRVLAVQAQTPEPMDDSSCAGPWAYDLLLALLIEFQSAWQARAVPKPCAAALLKFAAALPSAALARWQVARLQQQLQSEAFRGVIGADRTLGAPLAALLARLDAASAEFLNADTFAANGSNAEPEVRTPQLCFLRSALGTSS
jgi:hypothetical protein